MLATIRSLTLSSLALFATIAVASAFATSSAPAVQQQGCPFPCPATDGSSSAGIKPNCAQFVVTLYDLQPGDHNWLLNQETGELECKTCEPCEAIAGFTYSFTQCGGAYGVVYNDCGVLTAVQGNFRLPLSANCGKSKSHEFQMGNPNPNFDPEDCDAEPPFNGGAVYTLTATLQCGGC